MDFVGSPLNATITCNAINLHTEKTTLQWLRDEAVLESDGPTTISTSKCSHSLRSELTVTKRDWDNGKKFSCNVFNEKFNGIRNISKPLICGNLPVPVKVETIQPSYADIFQTKTAILTCRISNIPENQDLKDLKVTWTRAVDGRPLETILKPSQEQESSGLLFKDAVATVRADEWNKGETFNCKIIHPALFPSMEVRSLRKPQDGNPSAPHIYILPPPSDQLALQETATVTCLMKDFSPPEFFVKWLQNDEPVDASKYFTSTATQESKAPKRYYAYSMLNVNAEEWNSGTTYTCVVGHEMLPLQTSQKTIDKNMDLLVPVKVETIQPSFVDIFQTKMANLTCRISNIPEEQDLKELKVTWTRADDDTPLETILKPSQEQESSGLLFKDAVATVCADEWNKGETFKCKINHPALFPSMEVRSLRKPQDGNPSAPHIYILPPPSDQLALQETATVTCLMKDFSPPEFFVKWLRNDEPMDDSEYFTSTATQESKAPKRYYAYSMLNVNAEEWNSGTTYTCVVGHEMLPLQTSQKTVDKNTGKPTVVNVSLVLSDIASTCQ
uniref:Ig-like domain-containing protein n=1 Tax=Podarcis muralis TaxID=64176 RepID=A0A670K5N5_PODMU